MSPTAEQQSTPATASDFNIEKYLKDRMDAFFKDLEEKTMKWMTETIQAFRVEMNNNIENLRTHTQGAVAGLHQEIAKRDVAMEILKDSVVKMKQATLEQGVHDRKRDLLISDIPHETPAQLEKKVRDNFVTTLQLPQADVDKYVFTARHRLQANPRSNAPPKVIVVFVDLDHINQVLAAARNKGRQGQHIQTHLPRELQSFKSHCLHQRRLLIDTGRDQRDIRVRERRGFPVLQIKEGSAFVDKLWYVVNLNDNIPYPYLIEVPRPAPPASHM